MNNEKLDIISNILLKRNLNVLMKIEKERLGFKKNDLVFIGMANLAELHVCKMQSYLESKDMEIQFFNSYLSDRLKYSILIKDIDLNEEISDLDLLKICNDLSLEEIEEFVFKENKLIGKVVESPLKDSKLKIAKNLEPTAQGSIYEMIYGEKYPKIRWNFKIDKIVLVGVADGLRGDIIYEFKRYGNSYLMNASKKRAETQGDIYGYFFKRSKKRMHYFLKETEEQIIDEKKIDEQNVLRTINTFYEILEGKTEGPEYKWFCNNCKFNQDCKFSSKKSNY